jgi:hypothetical protein
MLLYLRCSELLLTSGFLIGCCLAAPLHYQDRSGCCGSRQSQGMGHNGGQHQYYQQHGQQQHKQHHRRSGGNTMMAALAAAFAGCLCCEVLM